MARTHNDHLVQTDGTGRVAIRTSDGRHFDLLRVSDDMPLQRCGSLATAQARATDMTTKGEV